MWNVSCSCYPNKMQCRNILSPLFGPTWGAFDTEVVPDCRTHKLNQHHSGFDAPSTNAGSSMQAPSPEMWELDD